MAVEMMSWCSNMAPLMDHGVWGMKAGKEPQWTKAKFQILHVGLDPDC